MAILIITAAKEEVSQSSIKSEKATKTPNYVKSEIISTATSLIQLLLYIWTRRAGLCVYNTDAPCLFIQLWKSRYLNLCYNFIKIAKIKIQGLNMLSKTAQCPFNRPLMLYSSSPRILSFLDSHTYFYFSTFEKQLRALFVPSLHAYQIPGSSGSTLIRAAQAAVSRATSSKRLLGHPEAFPDQLEYYNPSRVFWASSQSDVPRIPPRGGFRETS